MQTIFVGIDVGKYRLDIQLGENFFQVDNNESGIKLLISRLKQATDKEKSIKLITCEASGGYEILVVQNLREADYPVHIAHANKVRAFAKSKGYLAKTDKIDARVIQEYAHTFQLEADKCYLTADAAKIGYLLKRREQLLADKQRELNRLDKCRYSEIQSSLTTHIKWLETEIESIDNHLRALRNSTDIKQQHQLLTSVPAVGDLTAQYLIAFLPELGKLSHKTLAALVGVAPFNRDSGQSRGKRFIQGGRKFIRHALYMSAVAALRWNSSLKQFYERLRAAGKPAKVALIAVIRKLITMLNSVIRRQTPWVEKLTIS